MKNKLLTVCKESTLLNTLTYKSEKFGDRIKISFSDGFYCFAMRLSEFKMDDYLCSRFIRDLFNEDCISDVTYLISPAVTKILAVMQECSVQRKNPTPYLMALKTPGILMTMLIHGYHTIMNFANIGVTVDNPTLSELKLRLSHYTHTVTDNVVSEQILCEKYAKDLKKLRARWTLIKKTQEDKSIISSKKYIPYMDIMADIELDALNLTLMRFKRGKHSNYDFPDVRTAIARYFCLISPNLLYGCFIDDHLFELLVDSKNVDEALKVCAFNACLHIAVTQLAVLYDDVASVRHMNDAFSLTKATTGRSFGMGNDNPCFLQNCVKRIKGVK